MTSQIGVSQQHNPNKRRMDDEEPIEAKRYFDLSTQFSSNQPLITESLPSITFASPDYRPPPRSDALWLQPIPAQTVLSNTNTGSSSPATEDESEDDSLLGLSVLPLFQQQQSQDKSINEYWDNMVVDQWP